MNLLKKSIPYYFLFIGIIFSEGSSFSMNLNELLNQSQVEAIEANYTINKQNAQNTLIVNTTIQKHTGIKISSGSENWNFSQSANLKITVRNTCENKISIWAAVEAKSKYDPESTKSSHVPFSVTLEPEETGQIILPLFIGGKKLDQTYRLIPGRGYPIGSGELDLSHVEKISIYLKKAVHPASFEISELKLMGDVEIVSSNSFFPWVDKLGQNKHATWPGKIKDENMLIQSARIEQQEIINQKEIPNRDRFGGYLSTIKAESTGYFYAKKIDNKWWLIDPLGNPFFSHGVDGVGRTSPTPIDYREHYYESLPMDPMFNECWTIGQWGANGWYGKGKHVPNRQFDFLKANLIRKYGNNWKNEFRDLTYLRFKKWGINTMGNWSQAYMYEGDKESKIPYVVSASSSGSKPIVGSIGWWRKFPDPFDSSFEKSIRDSLKQYGRSVTTDPYCIGFFVDNEQSWGEETTLALSTLKSPSNQEAKKRFIQDLKNKYQTIENLNAHWNMSIPSWDIFLAKSIEPNEEILSVKEDLLAFNSKIIRKYFKTAKSEVKRIAPNHMYLGCRFSSNMMNNHVLQHISQDYCDVLTYNIYNLFPYGFSKGLDKPIFIGEFHFGALDRGVLHTGLWSAKNQKDRAKRYQDYVEYALNHPLIVGTHWFQYRAQSITGRADGENYQIGFCDICDQPYPELIESVTHIGHSMYETRCRSNPKE